MTAESIPVDWLGQRSQRFNEQCGVSGFMSTKGPRGGNHHVDRCTCQQRDTTPHKHYAEPPYSCARCVECKGYTPAVPSQTKVLVGRVYSTMRSTWGEWPDKTFEEVCATVGKRREDGKVNDAPDEIIEVVIVRRAVVKGEIRVETQDG